MESIEKLKQYGYIFNVQGGYISFEYKGSREPPPDVNNLLEGIRDNKQQAIKYLTWNEQIAYNRITAMHKRLSELPWIDDMAFNMLMKSNPELYNTEIDLSKAIDHCYIDRDMYELDKNISRYEAVVNQICNSICAKPYVKG